LFSPRFKFAYMIILAQRIFICKQKKYFLLKKYPASLEAGRTKENNDQRTINNQNLR